MPAKFDRVLNLVVDQRFHRSPDGAVWSHTPPAYPFFEQALEVYDHIRLIARTNDVTEPPSTARRVDGPGVELLAVPAYVGPFQYLFKRSEVIRRLSAIADLDGAFLMRIPSQTAFLLAEFLERKGRPYSSELLTDPHDFFAPGVSPHGLAFWFRSYFCRRSRQLCERSVAANFVTGSRTREAHPTPRAIWSSRISDVDLPIEAFLPIEGRAPSRSVRIVTVGYLDLLYKGQDVLLHSLAAARLRGLDFELTFVGDGENRTRLAELAASLGIGDQVHFTGPLGGPSAVRQELAQSDLFVLPSRAEGIPRALLEAMAAGLPAICSNVGAMPDLVESRWIIPSGDPASLTTRILEFAAIRPQWRAIADRNQQAARGFESTILRPQRRQFYQAVWNAHESSLRPEELIHAA